MARTRKSDEEGSGPEGRNAGEGGEGQEGSGGLRGIRLLSAAQARAGAGAPAADDEGGAQPRAERYIISHLLSVHGAGAPRRDAVDVFNTRLQRVLPEVSVLSDVAPAVASGPGESDAPVRRVLVVEADAAELRALAPQLTRDTVIEPLRPRVPAVASPAAFLAATAAAAGTAPPTAGTGSVLELLLRDPSGQPVPRAMVTVRFAGTQNPNDVMFGGGRSNDAGAVSVAFDPNLWRPVLAGVEPDGRYWTHVTQMPQSGQTIQLRVLPETGPLSWWQLLSGAVTYSPRAGSGVRVGVIDSGVGPHPALEHATPIGAILGGQFYPGAEEGRDVQMHGTHVSGIIGARPVNPQAYAGIAAGADLYVARVFTPGGDASQGDVAMAIDALSGWYGADIINMSLGGVASDIEHDAVILAFQRGTLCVCAAGNQSGGPVMYPAAYPECVAVSGLGLLNTSPADSMPALSVPTLPDRFGLDGIYLASFSNLGPQIDVAAPGNGIISTVPTNPGDAAPYADMSGTSMASPLVTGVLANLLSRDPAYRSLGRTAARAAYARALLNARAIPVLNNRLYEGNGMAREI
jgi:subtilisin family serine protease